MAQIISTARQKEVCNRWNFGYPLRRLLRYPNGIQKPILAVKKPINRFKSCHGGHLFGLPHREFLGYFHIDIFIL